MTNLQSDCKSVKEGAIFETYVVGEIIKSYYNSGNSMPRIFHYRDKEKKKVDLMIEQVGVF